MSPVPVASWNPATSGSNRALWAHLLARKIAAETETAKSDAERVVKIALLIRETMAIESVRTALSAPSAPVLQEGAR